MHLTNYLDRGDYTAYQWSMIEPRVAYAHEAITVIADTYAVGGTQAASQAQNMMARSIMIAGGAIHAAVACLRQAKARGSVAVTARGAGSDGLSDATQGALEQLRSDVLGALNYEVARMVFSADAVPTAITVLLAEIWDVIDALALVWLAAGYRFRYPT
jgi:hypothetical protein